jgi:hypothetical protein
MARALLKGSTVIPRTTWTIAPWLVAFALVAAACGGRVNVQVPDRPPPASVLADLWIDPGPQPRDLFWGIGGKEYAPPADALYALKSRDDAGFSVSYDVVGPDQTEWSAKIGPEAQTETVLSRILWGLGYHQPPLYYLPSWKLDRGREELRIESEARFRPKLKNLVRLKEYWHWADNPLLGAREFRGMLVILLMLNSTDLKDDNNSIYKLTEPWDGADRWFVVRDIGAALGRTGKLFPHRNWIDGFERQGFIRRIANGKITFDYTGRHQEILEMIAPDDVQWAARQMQRLTDAQWKDAFRAGNYAEPVAERFVRRIKEKISDGLALRPDVRLAENQ